MSWEDSELLPESEVLGMRKGAGAEQKGVWERLRIGFEGQKGVEAARGVDLEQQIEAVAAVVEP